MSTETKDAAVAARKTERNPMRCNPDTEFRLGWDARDAEVAEVAEAIAQRDASRAVNADLLAAANRAALAAQSDFFTAQPMNSDDGRDE